MAKHTTTQATQVDYLVKTAESLAYLARSLQASDLEESTIINIVCEALGIPDMF